MNKKISLGAAICFMAIAAAISFIVTMYYSLNIFNSKVANVSEREEQYAKLAEIDTIIRNNYLGEIDEEALMDSLADGYVDGLEDQYSVYMNQEEYKQYQQQNAGELIGIGVTATLDDSGYLEVVSVSSESPAEAGGLMAGDMIIRIDDADVLAMGYENAINAIRGEDGTVVNITYRRDSEEYTVSITRKRVKDSGISYRMIDTLGYVQIQDFNATTPADFEYAVNDLMSQGATGLIFDLRGNGGGLVSSVAEMLDFLLPEGDLVSQTNSKKETTVLYTSDSDCIDLPMVCLMNGDTASAAELFVCDLRDFQVAELVGETTYGKGVMQTAFPLEDGSAISLTTAYYNPASGVNYHGVGVKPDYEVVLTAEQKQNLANLDENTDPQLMKAISVLKSK